ncbi:MAG: hypothetical protein JNK35_04810 [Phycisphaerae bacterium]|nr:hypothetical protein [Phycisphaerae bacterium]
MLGGCGGRGASQGQENLITGPAFPSGRQQARVLDVQVTRAETQITFTNTTARSLPACTMWLNRRFGLALEPLPIGATRTLDLRDFKDEYGEAFRGGGFFATEAPDRVVLAQLDLGDELVGLIVIGGQP